MKTLARLIFLALVVQSPPSLSAPTVTRYLSGFQGPTPLTSTSFGTSVPAGDDIVVQVQSPGNPKGSSGPTSANVVITDSVDGVAFVACNFYFDPTNNTYAALYHHVVVGPGTRTITVTQTNSTWAEAAAIDVSSFAGTPTCDNSLNTTGGSTTQVITATLSPAITGQNNEIAFFVIGGGGYFPTTPAGYTNINSGGLETGFNIQGASGNTVAMTATYNTPVTWDGVIGGIYDSAGPTQPLGINLEKPYFYTTEQPFLNLLKSAGSAAAYNAGWYTGNGTQDHDTAEEAYLQLDSNGYATSLTASPT